jgi:gallate decarboxylase subunit D
MSRLKTIHLTTTEELFPVEAQACFIGNDLLVSIWGGEKPHIGATAAAQPRPSLSNEAGKISATSSVLTYLGHKEDMIVKMAAESLASVLNTNVVVTAGIHWDGLNTDAIEIIWNRCLELVEKLQDQLTRDQ